jgi:hypothetical protein
VPDAIYRYEVPVDDEWHEVKLSSEVLHVGCRTPDVIEFWAWRRDGLQIPRSFRVVGTGQPLATEPMKHVGTTLVPGGELVWHLMERP